MSADTLLSHLDNVRQTGPDSWMACCPAHDDRSASLSIRQTDDKTLIHCFAGCTVHEVVGAVGLDIADLFPPRQQHGKPERRPFPAMDALRGVAFKRWSSRRLHPPYWLGIPFPLLTASA